MEERILQIYRSNNVWLTKNMAKAIVEKNIKQLHPNNTATSAKDGEPIVARYYTEADGYSFTYSSTPLSSDPYAGQYSCEHNWIDGFDTFTQVPLSANYKSAYYIRVGTSDSWQYYVLEPYPLTPPQLSSSVRISSVTGIVFNKNVNASGSEVNKTYIDWIDPDFKNEIENMSVNQKRYVYNPSTGMMELVITGNDVTLAENASGIKSITEIDHIPNNTNPPGIYVYNGNIYIWDGATSVLWRLDANTTVTDAISVLNHLSYNIDMGKYKLV